MSAGAVCESWRHCLGWALALALFPLTLAAVSLLALKSRASALRSSGRKGTGRLTKIREKSEVGMSRRGRGQEKDR